MKEYLDPAALAMLCGGATKTWQGYAARCPAHEDKQASVSISQGRIGTLIHCHAGCSLDDICNALGIWSAQLRSSSPDTPTPNDRRRPLLSTLRRLEARLRPPSRYELMPHQSLEDVLYEVLSPSVKVETWAEVGVRWRDLLAAPFPTMMGKPWLVTDAICADLLVDWINEGWDYSVAERRRLIDSLWKEWWAHGDSG